METTESARTRDFLYRRGEYTGASWPGLILLDIKLPRIDGIEILRRIKADADLKSIPVVMLTTSVSDAEMVESYNYGANSYLVKPVDFEQFAEVIKELKSYWLTISSSPR